MPDRRNKAHKKTVDINKKKRVKILEKSSPLKRSSEKICEVIFTEDGEIYVKQGGTWLSAEVAGF